MLIEEAAQDVDLVAEQDRAELTELVAEVDVAGRVRGRWAGLGTQGQRVLRRLVARRLHQSCASLLSVSSVYTICSSPAMRGEPRNASTRKPRTPASSWASMPRS